MFRPGMVIPVLCGPPAALSTLARPLLTFLRPHETLDSMTGLTTELLGRACRIFLALAYPQGTNSLSPGRRCFSSMAPDEPLAKFVELPEVCEKLYTPEGALRGLAFRLGSTRF